MVMPPIECPTITICPAGISALMKSAASVAS
ncbi:Uncharacterised protein [Mycobacteroides abscessus subsp. abscessus]|nr:Uncharacterised protein [Mycobacteroides abscessus subsp. abscessus]